MSESEKTAESFLRATGLRAEELFYAPWRGPSQNALDPPEFDARDCVRRLARVRSDEYCHRVEWHRAGLEWPMSRREARFWFAAFTHYEEQAPSRLGELILDQVDLDSSVDWKQVDYAFGTLSSEMLEAERLLVLSQLLPPEEILDELLAPPRLRNRLWMETAVGAAPYVISQLEPDVRARYEDRLRLVADDADLGGVGQVGVENLLAAALGLHEQVQRRVAGWQDGDLEKTRGHLFAVLFGLGNASELAYHASRLKVRLRSRWQLKGWLAHHGLEAMDPVRTSLLTWDWHKSGLEALVSVLERGDGPELAPVFLDLMVDSKVRESARKWLIGHPRSTVLGLASRIGGQGKAASAAESLLRGLLRDNGELLEEMAQELDERDVERLRGLETPRVAVPSGELPPGLVEAFERAPKGWRRKRSPKWLEVASLPPVLAGDGALDEAQTHLLLVALRESLLGDIAGGPATEEEEGPGWRLLDRVRELADEKSLDDFARELYQQWFHAGAQGKDKWALHALGHLGAEPSVLLLMPQVEKWRAQQQYQKTTQGVVAAVGLAGRGGAAGDLAVMHFDRIHRTTKRPSLRRQADEALAGIARRRGLTRAELMDRSIPDLGLGPGASHTIDYGTRTFDLVIGEDLKPRVRDAKGKLRATPPKPGVRDGEQAAEARAAFMDLKKQLVQVLKIQSQRLERAMVQARRWSRDDFQTLLVDHPLMGLLVRRLIWGVYPNGKLAASFRVSAEGELLDVDDEPVSTLGPQGGTDNHIGVVHALELEETQRKAWSAVIADYELAAPFPQLGRPLYELTVQEAGETELTRFCGASMPSETLVFGLERLGWLRGPLGDGMGLCELAKPFYGHGLTAIIDGSMDGSVIAGGFGDSHPGFLRNVTLVPGVFHTLTEGDGNYGNRPQPIHWGEAPPVIASEVLADLDFLARKAKAG